MVDASTSTDSAGSTPSASRPTSPKVTPTADAGTQTPTKKSRTYYFLNPNGPVRFGLPAIPALGYPYPIADTQYTRRMMRTGIVPVTSPVISTLPIAPVLGGIPDTPTGRAFMHAQPKAAIRATLPLSPALTVSDDGDVDFSFKPTPFVGVVAPFNRISRYQSLDNDVQLRKRMAKKFYHRTIRWLLTDMVDVLSYLTINKSGAVSLIKKDGVKHETHNVNENRKKVEWLQDEFLTKNFMGKMLTKYIRTHHSNWYSLEVEARMVKMDIENQLKRLLRRIINKD